MGIYTTDSLTFFAHASFSKDTLVCNDNDDAFNRDHWLDYTGTISGTLYNFQYPSDITTDGWDNFTQFGESLKLDGTDDYVGWGDNSAFNMTANQTIEFWYRPISSGTYENQKILYRYQDANNYWYVNIEKATGTLTMAGKYGGTAFSRKTVNKPTFGNWHHVVVSRAGTTISIDVDNVTQTLTDGTTYAIGATAGMWTSGKGNATDTYCGRIALWRLYSKALSTGEKTTNFNCGRGGWTRHRATSTSQASIGAQASAITRNLFATIATVARSTAGGFIKGTRKVLAYVEDITSVSNVQSEATQSPKNKLGNISASVSTQNRLNAPRKAHRCVSWNKTQIRINARVGIVATGLYVEYTQLPAGDDYWALCRKVLSALQFMEPPDFSGMYEIEHVKIKNLLNQNLRRICSSELNKWFFRERKTTFSLISGRPDYLKPDGVVKNIRVEDITYPLLPEYDYTYLREVPPSKPQRYALFNNRLYLYPAPSDDWAGKIATVEFYTNQFAQDIKGNPKIEMTEATDHPIIPHEFRDILVYGAVKDYIGVGAGSRFEEYNRLYLEVFDTMRGNLKRSEEMQPEITFQSRSDNDINYIIDKFFGG